MITKNQLGDKCDKIHVVFIRSNLADEYNAHTGATIASILEHCSKPVVIHIFHEGILSDANPVKRDSEIAKYEELVDRYNAEIEFHSITFPKWVNEETVPSLKIFPKIMLARFYFQDYLKDLHRIISIDSDIIVKLDLSKLFQLAPVDKTIVAQYYKFDKKTIKRNNLDNIASILNTDITKVFNNGISILNLDKLRLRGNLPDLAYSIIKNNQATPLNEEWILTVLFSSDIYDLENLTSVLPRYYVSESDIENYIIRQENSMLPGYIYHYSGGEKPWKNIYTKYDLDYWEYFFKTPWGEEDMAYYKFKEALHLPSDVLSNIDVYSIKVPPFSKKQVMMRLWNYTIPLYLKLVGRVLHIKNQVYDEKR